MKAFNAFRIKPLYMKHCIVLLIGYIVITKATTGCGHNKCIIYLLSCFSIIKSTSFTSSAHELSHCSLGYTNNRL